MCPDSGKSLGLWQRQPGNPNLWVGNRPSVDELGVKNNKAEEYSGAQDKDLLPGLTGVLQEVESLGGDNI